MRNKDDLRKIIKLLSAFKMIQTIRNNLGINSLRQLEVLLSVMIQEGRSQVKIAESVDMEASQVALTLKRLKEKGLVDDCVVFARTKAVDLTPKARRFKDFICKQKALGEKRIT
jgi:DNA-binding MarR family transcriptional regulator